MLLKNLILIFLVLIPPTIVAAAEVSPQIYTTIKSFFGMTGNKLILHGELINTATEFGRHCQLTINFLPPGKGFLALKNEYTPQAMVGEGIFFDEGSITYSFNQSPPQNNNSTAKTGRYLLYLDYDRVAGNQRFSVLYNYYQEHTKFFIFHR